MTSQGLMPARNAGLSSHRPNISYPEQCKAQPRTKALGTRLRKALALGMAYRRGDGCETH